MSLLIQEAPLQLIPSLAKAIGLNEAMVLQQLHYWVDRSSDGWVYNTYEQWQEQFPFWSTRTISRIFNNLEAAGYVRSKQSDSYYRVKYYTIDYDKVNELESPKTTTCPDAKTTTCRDRSGQIGSFNSLDYTETTTETTKYSASSQKSDEPTLETVTIVTPFFPENVKNPKNTDNSGVVPDMLQDGYANDTYSEKPANLAPLSTTRQVKVTPKKTLSKPRESDRTNNTEHYRLYLALCEATNNNPMLQSRKVHGICKKLVKAGYTVSDLQDFKLYWQRDWRYARDKRAPTPEELYADIEKSAKLYRESVQTELTEQELKDMFVGGIIPDILR